MQRLSLIALLLLSLSSLTLPARAATINVGCSVNELIAAMLQARDNDEINLAAGCTYTLNQLYYSSFTGLPQVSYIITIHGNGAIIQRSQVAGTPKFRPFYVAPSGSLTIDNLTLRYGDSGSASGGSIYNYFGKVNVINSTITGNKAPNGGGILNYNGTVTVSNSTISGNTATDGGGIYSYLGTATVSNSTISGNTSPGGRGGGLFNLMGTASVSNSTIANNSANAGGGISNNGGSSGISTGTLYGDMMDIMSPRPIALALANATSVKLTVSNSTVSGNSASIGGGISNGGGGIVALGSTIVSLNTAPTAPDFSGAVSSLGWNVIGSTTGATISGTTTGNLTNAAASPLNLGPLADNGGPTQTMALLAGSVAATHGNCTTLAGVAPVTTDQRGVARRPACDVGAYESNILPDAIFSDGFESGNLSAWSSKSIDGGDLAVIAGAQQTGSNYGMRARINDNHDMYVQDDTPGAEARYRARFYFDPNTVTMANGDRFTLFSGYQGTSTLVLQIELRKSGAAYQLRAGLRDDAANWTYTSYYTISDAPHIVEIDWQAATAAGANNGSLAFWIDESLKQTLSSIDNDTRRIDTARLGAVTGLDAGTSGVVYFDAFRSTRTSYIGAEAGGLGMFIAPETFTPETREPARDVIVQPVTEPALLPFSVPVFQTMDDGAPLWSASAGWQLSDAAAYSGLGWQATASGSTETLALTVPVNLAGTSAPTLSFQSKLVSASLPEVQASVDGVNWQAIASVTPSPDWMVANVDLSAYAGQTIQLRLVWIASAGTGETWQVDEVTVSDGITQPPVEPTLPPAPPETPAVEPPVVLPTTVPREGGSLPDTPADLPPAPVG